MVFARKLRFTMTEHTVLNLGSLGLILGNLILGVSLMDAFNLVAAGLGTIVTIIANVDRIVISILRVRDIRRNGWRLPGRTPEPVAPEKPEKSDAA